MLGMFTAGCGLGIMRGPNDRVLAEAQEVFTASGHSCRTQGESIVCDERSPSKQPLLISTGGTALGFATYVDTQPAFGQSCASLAPSVEATTRSLDLKVDCTMTSDKVDRLLILGAAPIPSDGMTAEECDEAATSFLTTSHDWVERLKQANATP